MRKSAAWKVLERLKTQPYVSVEHFSKGFRLAPRILELRQRGHQIKTHMEKGKCCKYTYHGWVQNQVSTRPMEAMW